jgi:phage/plasmid-like protein (TIGR03299 family)
MSAEVETMAYSGEVPWHGLGVRVESNLTPEEMMDAAGVNWEVSKVPAYATVNSKKIFVNHSALVRNTDSKILDVVGEDWNITQNSEAFDFFLDFIEKGHMEMHTAGSLREGRIVWALAKVKDSSFSLFGGDQVDAYMLFTNPHMYGKSIDIRFTPIRVVCNNTLSLSLSGKDDNFVKVSHASKFDAEKVKDIMGIARTKLNTYEDIANFLGSKRYTKINVAKYFGEIFPVISKKENAKKYSKSASLALTVLDTQPGSEYASGSWWSAVNAVTYCTDHLIGRNVDNRMTSAWFGINKGLKVKAFQKAVEYAESA